MYKLRYKQKIRTLFLLEKFGSDFSGLVRETGLEPVRDYHTPLKRARLPIPPLSHIQLRPSRNDCYYIKVKYICQHFFTNILKKISGIFLTVPKAQNQKNVAEFLFKTLSSAGVICLQS